MTQSLKMFFAAALAASLSFAIIPGSAQAHGGWGGGGWGGGGGGWHGGGWGGGFRGGWDGGGWRGGGWGWGGFVGVPFAFGYYSYPYGYPYIYSYPYGSYYQPSPDYMAPATGPMAGYPYSTQQTPGFTCFAGRYVCPLQVIHPMNGACSCPADNGIRVRGTVG